MTPLLELKNVSKVFGKGVGGDGSVSLKSFVIVRRLSGIGADFLKRSFSCQYQNPSTTSTIAARTMPVLIRFLGPKTDDNRTDFEETDRLFFFSLLITPLRVV